MNERVVKNPNFANEVEFHASLRARGAGAKDYPNTHTEVEHLGNGKFAASIGVGHRVFFDKADGNKPKKHKLTDERPGKDYILIQGPKCCVEVYPYYAKYFDVNHEGVRLYEECWVVQRLFKAPDDWRDVDAYNPIISVEEYPEPAGDVAKVTVIYDTDYGSLVVEYFQRDGNALKHNVTFKNTSGGDETFRILQKWAGIVGAKCNGKGPSVDIDEPFLAFHQVDKPARAFTIAENLWSMIFNLDGSEKTDQCLKRPISIDTHAQGMKADFIYSNWVLTEGESLTVDPDTVTLDDPTEDGYADTKYGRDNTGDRIYFGKYESGGVRTSRGYVEWDISTIPLSSSVTKVEFRYHGAIHDTSGDNTDTRGVSVRPSTSSDGDLYDAIGSGTTYLSNNATFPEQSTNKDVGGALGPAWDTDPSSDVETALADGWWAFGFKTQETESPETYEDFRHGIFSEEYLDGGATPKPTLYVEYTLPAAVGRSHGYIIG